MVKHGRMLTVRSMRRERASPGEALTPDAVRMSIAVPMASKPSSPSQKSADSEAGRALVAPVIAKWSSSPEAVALTTAAASAQQARVVWVNAAFLSLTGYSESQIIGASTVMLQGAHPTPIGLGEIELLHDHPENMPFGIISTKERPNHTHYTTTERIEPLHDSTGALTHYLVIQKKL